MSQPNLDAGLSGFVRRMADDHAPDADLLRRYVATRDGLAFAALVRRHGPTVWRVCRGLARQPADAEDAYQATFLVLVRNAGRVRNPHAVGAWLYGTAVKVATKARTRRRPEPFDVEPPGPLDDLRVREAEAIFHTELASLPAECRDPLVLCCLEGLSRDEAAAALGLSPAAVKHRLERGREVLKARLLRRGIAVGVPLLAGLLSSPAAAAPGISVNCVSAGAISLADEVPNMTLAKWVLAIAVGLVVTAGGFGVPLLAGDPPKAKSPVEAKAKPVEKRVAEIALGEHLQRATTSRDGKVLATVTRKDNDNANPVVVQFWDTATGKQLGALGEIRNNRPLNIALSPDGSAFAWARHTTKGQDCDIEVYDVKKGELRGSSRRGPLFDVTFHDIQFSADGKLTVSTDAKLRPVPGGKLFITGGATVASAETGEAVHTVAGHTGDAANPERGHASAPLFLGDGKRFATVGKKDLKVVIWDTESGQQADTFSLADCVEVMTNAVTPDGKKLVTFHENGENVVWDIESGKRAVELDEPEGNVLHAGAVSVSRDGKRVAAVVNPPNGKLKLKVWDVASGKLLLTKGDVGPQAACFDAAGRVAVCDGSLKTIVFHPVPE